MEKIVVLTDPAEDDSLLIACLHILFPDCEIRVHSRRGKEIRACACLREAALKNWEEENDKHPHCR